MYRLRWILTFLLLPYVIIIVNIIIISIVITTAFIFIPGTSLDDSRIIITSFIDVMLGSLGFILFEIWLTFIFFIATYLAVWASLEEIEEETIYNHKKKLEGENASTN